MLTVGRAAVIGFAIGFLLAFLPIAGLASLFGFSLSGGVALGLTFIAVFAGVIGAILGVILFFVARALGRNLSLILAIALVGVGLLGIPLTELPGLILAVLAFQVSGGRRGGGR
jgi:hypothetical protein